MCDLYPMVSTNYSRFNLKLLNPDALLMISFSEFPAPPFRRVTRSSTSEAATVAGSSRDANQVTGGGDESLGAWGGSSRPANVLDLVRTQVRSL